MRQKIEEQIKEFLNKIEQIIDNTPMDNGFVYRYMKTGLIINVLLCLLCSGLVLSTSVEIQEEENDINLDENHISYEQVDFKKSYGQLYHIDCNGNGEIDVAESNTILNSLTISDISEACTNNEESFDREDYYVWTDTAFNEGENDE